MKQTNYMQTISKANTLEELTQIKESFLSECKKREQTILVSNILGQINDFCGAQAIFESMIVPLMGKKGGKNLINKYTKIIITSIMIVLISITCVYFIMPLINKINFVVLLHGFNLLLWRKSKVNFCKPLITIF